MFASLSLRNAIAVYYEPAPPDFVGDFDEMVSLIERFENEGGEDRLEPGSLFFDIMFGMSYQTFLKTKYWKIVSNQCKRHYGWRCALCYQADDLHTHHRTYRKHFSEHRNLCNLIALCPSCHRKFHDIVPEWRRG